MDWREEYQRKLISAEEAANKLGYKLKVLALAREALIMPIGA